MNLEAIEIIAELMALAARTAPKAAGKDYVVTKTVTGDDVRRLGEEMKAYGRDPKHHDFIERDGKNVENSQAVLLVGLKDAAVMGLDCAACGEPSCTAINTHEGEFKGPQCALRLLDMGIAVGSAVKTASLHNVDNRVMYSAGVLARKMELIDADVAVGIPLSASGKSIYFDRK
jgi:uncharacterized ferredoxin-like protein